MSRIKKIFLFSIVILFLGIIVSTLFNEGYLRLNNPSFDKYPIHGLDISHHQGVINWDVLLDKDRKYVQFVFIKATEGVTHVDSKFFDNWQEAKKRNLPVGAYHFFTFCTKGKEQAEDFINTVPYDSLSLAPVIDLEFGGNCKVENRFPDLMNEIDEFISIVENHYKKKVIIYATQEFYDLYLVDNLKDNPIWIRDIYSEPQLEKGRNWQFWQYANRGRLNGVDTFVDINVFSGTKDDFVKLQKILYKMILG